MKVGRQRRRPRPGRLTDGGRAGWRGGWREKEGSTRELRVRKVYCITTKGTSLSYRADRQARFTEHRDRIKAEKNRPNDDGWPRPGTDGWLGICRCLPSEALIVFTLLPSRRLHITLGVAPPHPLQVLGSPPMKMGTILTRGDLVSLVDPYGAVKNSSRETRDHT